MFNLGSKEPVIAKARTLIECPPDQIFRYLGDGFFENYPKWSPEVVELESITDGPLKLGTIARQVRIDQGRRTETKFTIDVYEPNKRLGFVGVSDPFRCTYELRDINSGRSAELIFTFELSEIQMFMRPFEKLIRIVVQEGAERTVRNLKQLTEAAKCVATSSTP
ncbi:Polyketide cyclase / dehydrase and lipid transport [Nitrosospira sp. Nl5]|uniref:SRPBCC family protein n=1 Tax=Nitrosospira sp. Nl5 TaxID=200120 RepID=UPI0008913F57|nr:SRPBCC family protein [Nitrosospira sp. Nl5]SCY01392.1 Polyketide cyclase / dehydrase and lipid transport [Nitrosospira sp. Nl5]